MQEPDATDYKREKYSDNKKAAFKPLFSAMPFIPLQTGDSHVTSVSHSLSQGGSNSASHLAKRDESTK